MAQDNIDKNNKHLDDQLTGEYFDTLSQRIMDRIDKYEEQRKNPRNSIRLILKPLLYMAASFLIVIGGIKMLRWSIPHNNPEIASQEFTHQEEDDYYDYFLTIYDDAIQDEIMNEQLDSIPEENKVN